MSNKHIHSIRQSDVKRPDLQPSKESAEEALTAFMDYVMKAREVYGVGCVLISATVDFKKEDYHGSMGSVQVVGTELEAIKLIENSVWSLERRYELVTEEPTEEPK